MNLDDLPTAEFAFPGPLRDRLVAAILSGAKTSTSSLVLAYERENGALPEVGQPSAVVDSAGRRVAVIELIEVRVVRLADVDLQHVLDEGEGDESVAQWRSGHEEFWHSAEARAELEDPDFTQKLQAFAHAPHDAPVFICGGAMNQSDFLDLFTKRFMLCIDSDTMRQRLLTRTNNRFGKDPEDLAEQLELNTRVVEDANRVGSIIIDATRPINEVADDIVRMAL